MLRVGRNREKHKRWPKGWAKGPSRKDGTFDIYFRPTNAGDRAILKARTGGPLSLRLGATEDEASTTFAQQIIAARTQQTEVVPGTVSEICDLARRKYLPRIKNLETRAWRGRHVDELEKTFGKRRYARNVYEASRDTKGLYLRAMDVQKHITDNEDTRPVAVNRAVATWSQCFDFARAPGGLTEYNPCAGLKFNDEAPRDVLPDDRNHFFKVYRHLDPPARFVLAMGRYYGRRRGEVLRIELSGVATDGVHTVRGKRAKELILVWDDVELEQPDGSILTRPGRLRKMVARAMRWRDKVFRPQKIWKNGKRRQAPRVVATTLLVNRRGRRVSPTGFNTSFRRGMERAGLVTVLGEEMVNGKKRTRTRRAFNPNDTRAKRASTLTREQATDVLAHDDPRTTETVYRRGPHVIDMRDHALADSRRIPGNSRKGGSGRS